MQLLPFNLVSGLFPKLGAGLITCFTAGLILLAANTSQADAKHAHSPDTIRLATTTSIDSSGLLEFILPRFKSQHPYTIEISIVGSGKALKLGRSGLADVVWVHSPKAEQQFLSSGYGIQRTEIMRNQFVIAGPGSDPEELGQAKGVIEAFQLIDKKKITFVSRADDSGTHRKEQSLLELANVDPYGKSWYVESGAGMGKTLSLAESIGAYILIDRATLTVKSQSNFTPIVEDPDHLETIYNIMAINPEKVDGVNIEGATKLINWLKSEQGQQAIDNYSYNGKPLYKRAKPASNN